MNKDEEDLFNFKIDLTNIKNNSSIKDNHNNYLYLNILNLSGDNKTNKFYEKY